MADARLTFTGLGCTRGGRALFGDLQLALGPGGAALIRGPNGAGKSSLLRIAAGLMRASAGRVERSGGVGLVDERPALDEALPLGRALGFWGALDRQAAPLDRVGLAGLLSVPVRYLSTGQRRRAVLARLIAADVPIWLLDEPESGLDDAGTALLEELIAAHRATGGIVLVASHGLSPPPGAATVSLGRA